MDRIDLKILFKDINFRFLFLNMLLVLIGYATSKVLGLSAFGMIKIIRTIILFISIGFILNSNGFSTLKILNSQSIYIVVFFISVGSFFSEDHFTSLYRGITFILPFLYVVYCINYLLKYGAYNLLIGLSMMIMVVYLIVPISYLIFGVDLGNTMIYRTDEGEAFVSNHYGWSSSIYILSSLTVLRFYPLKKIYKYILIILLPFTFYLMIISASRSAMLALAVAFLFYIIKDTHVSLYNKIFLSIIPILILFFISLQENSVFEFLKQKNEQQLEAGAEGRYEAALMMIENFLNNPINFFLGIGMFNNEILVKGDAILIGYHNSYFEILFGVGIIVFFFFLFFMVIWPLIVFWKTTASFTLLIFPLMIIPFFESDLTAGQFLFFPWFSYMILLNAKEFHPKLRTVIQ